MNVAEKVETLIKDVIESRQMEIVDVVLAAEAGKKVLRIFLDKSGGFTMEDCEEMSRSLGDTIDASNIMPDNYVLEVSSPGLDRVLRKEKDFIRFIGSKVKLSLFAPVDGERNLGGIIVSCADGSLTVTEISGKTITLVLSNVARARLDPEIKI